MLAMCASHIGSVGRIASMECMLESWHAQQHPLPMYVAVSFATPQLAERARPMWKRFAVGLTVFAIARTRSQFQHYAWLVHHLQGTALPTKDKIEYECVWKPTEDVHAGHVPQTLLPVADDTFVLFSDDDDTWDPARSFVFHAILHESASTGELPTIRAALEERNPDDPEHKQLMERIRSATGVAPVVAREYYHYAIRFSCLADFIRKCDPMLLAHRYADCFLTRYLHTPNHTATDMKRFHYKHKLYSASVPMGAEWGAAGRAHACPYDPLLKQTRTMYECQLRRVEETKNVLDKQHRSKRTIAAVTEYNSQAARANKLASMLNRLIILAGFCSQMHSRYTVPDFNEFRSTMAEQEAYVDALMSPEKAATRAKAASVRERIPDEMRPLYETLVTTDPEFLRFIRAPLL
jgi:hypothetical protein